MAFRQKILDYVKSGETNKENLGLEIEHFIINSDGEQIPFDVVTALIENVANKLGADIHYIDGFPSGYFTDEYCVTLEPSCQFEISINPYSDIPKIEKIYADFISTWEPLFSEKGYNILAKGVLPSVEYEKITPDDIPLSPKKRYKYMDEYFRKSGHYGKYMMRASASTQVSVDYKSEQDLVKKLQVLQKISPILSIMMENKSDESTTLPGAKDKPHLLRIQEWDDLDPSRTGFYPDSLGSDFGYEKIADVIYKTPLILLTDKGETTGVGDNSAEKLEAAGTISIDDNDKTRNNQLVEHFMSMGFFHFRIKKYIEIRVADSVPIKKALGYTALLKGLVYSDFNLNLLDKELACVDSLCKIQSVIEKIEKAGKDAIIYNKKTASEWAAKLVDLARDVLPENEKEYLKYV
ncbi:glutamate-cysteine ligase family protein [Eubacterium xylanophilum]|uniref:glutamate-cysteine ligase family protein n=1 Tax=Eubacterium xylanophilum TaxID=39497 RepID=UPI00047A3C57|nr:glutamate-cysteine ligase family protein [Eubacterium xylanophilum]